MERILAGTRTPEAQQQEIERLQVLVEASKLINSSIEPTVLYSSILALARGQLGVERGTLYFVDEGKGEIWARIPAEGEVTEIRLPMGRGIAGTVAQTGETVVLEDVTTDPRFESSVDRRSGFRTRSMLCVPIRNRVGKIVGVLQLLNKRDGPFGPHDLAFLESVSDHVAIGMENATLHLSLLEKDRMQRELVLGREIQKRLLPEPPGDVPGTELAAANVSCFEVGGDYYDFLPLPEGGLALTIADVSGKGVAAALVMSSLQAALRVATPLGETLARLASRLDRLIFSMAGGRKYVTLFLSVYEPATGRLRYVNAGHNPPLVFFGDAVETLGPTGPPIGLLQKAAWTEGLATVPPGATLVLYTDGLTEAASPDEEELGLPGLVRIASSLRGRPAREVVDGILARVTQHEAGTPAGDDKTLVVLRRADA